MIFRAFDSTSEDGNQLEPKDNSIELSVSTLMDGAPCGCRVPIVA